MIERQFAAIRICERGCFPVVKRIDPVQIGLGYIGTDRRILYVTWLPQRFQRIS